VSDELIARLRAAADDVSKATPALSALAHGIKLVDWSPDIREAADRIERMAAAARDVVAAWRRSEHIPGNDSKWPNYMLALDAQVDWAAPNKLHNINLCPNCSEKDANIAELIETLQRTEAAHAAVERRCTECGARGGWHKAEFQHKAKQEGE
jgi:HAMP domain-containing protein